MQSLELKIELWKNRLLDLGKSNKLINFKENKRSNIAIASPKCGDIFKLIHDEKSLSFSYPLKTTFDERGEEQSLSVVKGDIETFCSINEQQRTLKSLRAKAKTSIEEQGVNILYLTFGMIRWREYDNFEIIASPIVLVPVNIKIESINQPYTINMINDGIIVNPSLLYKFNNDFNIKLPDFDEHEDNIVEYLDIISQIAKKNNWKVSDEVYLSLLSFLKINMYEDLNVNKDKIISNSFIKSISGDLNEIIQVPTYLNNYDHDRNTKSLDTFQVVDADSSQQDAIALAKNGISFVLQGPPGTGKSQTITNIIAESIAEGKKVLFVSEKMAALEVVKRRLEEAELNDFCLTLHSHRTNKKYVLSQLEDTIKIPKIKVQDELLYKLSELEEKKKILDEYQAELHTKCMALNTTIYEVNGKIAKLDNTIDLMFHIDDVKNTEVDKLNKYKYLINEYYDIAKNLKNDSFINPWIGSNILFLNHELRHDIDVRLSKLLPNFEDLLSLLDKIIKLTGAKLHYSYNNIQIIYEILNFLKNSPIVPSTWLNTNIEELIGLANQFSFKCKQYFDNKEQLKRKYKNIIFDISANEVHSIIEKELENVKLLFNPEKYISDKEIILNSDSILMELNELKELLTGCLINGKDVCDEISHSKPDSINDLIKLYELSTLLCKDIYPTEKWFNEVQFKDALKILDDAKQHQKLLNDNLIKVNNNFDSKILENKYDDYIDKYENEYADTLNILSRFYKIKDNDEINKNVISDFIIDENQRLVSSTKIIEDAVTSSEKVVELIGTNKISNLDDLKSLSLLICVLKNNPQIAESWFDNQKDSIVDNVIEEIKIKHSKCKDLQDEILDKYSRDILDIDYKGILSRFNNEYSGFLKKVRVAYKLDKKAILSCSKEQKTKITDSEIISLMIDISTLKEQEQWLKDNYEDTKEIIGNLYLENYTNWDAVNKSRDSFKFIKNYFGNFKIPEKLKSILISSSYDEINIEYNNLKEEPLVGAINYVCEIMGSSLLHMDIYEGLSLINGTINNSIALKNDFDIFQGYKLHSNNITIKEIKNVLYNTRDIHECRKWFKDKDYLIREYLGSNYIGLDTNFDIIDSSINNIKNIKELLNGNIPSKLINMLTNPKFKEDVYNKYILSYKKLIDLKVIDRLDIIFKGKNNSEKDLNDIFTNIDSVANSIILIHDNYYKVANKSNEKLQFEVIMSDISLLLKIQKIEDIFSDNEKNFKQKFHSYYNGIETDWTLVVEKLEYVKKLKQLISQYSIQNKFVKGVCEDKNIIEECGELLEKLTKSKELIHEDIIWFNNFFEEDLLDINIYNFYSKIKNCSNLTLLEDWIDFIEIRKLCINYGLEDFIEHIETNDLINKNIIDIFLKRFYKLWLDAVIPDFPAVFNFRSRNHQGIINDFNELDKLQLEIARLRIREKLTSRLPDINVATSSLDEIGILKRELNKNRRIMPLRKLFKSIPNLLTTLKPCMMMSPLSVSLYLDAETQEFDVVIFDEASQICTEDAIGAIIRGKQVIIAGDKYQLPPTNFFNNKISDNLFDFDYDDEYNDSDDFESILDEATNVIPERSLKWHYRSRHENLIAFSNSNIYKNELITFPSNVENDNDLGVEYIFVENGVYDRGTKKNNVIEARHVAELVFEHIKKHPNRSLGVVTFSEAQQQAIESAIRKKRIENFNYESFFAENKDEEFFVKNLENVQGDERDTIIFSIGYGKDANNIMYMNFGPLSKNGGYRRLNVAITRAKYNLKLVGSIMPEDINLEKTNSEGVKMLKSFIEYAINGTSSLEHELIIKENNDYDSSFSDAIYIFLTNKGYKVKTQVGCSSYKIDMAVEHPEIKGKYVLGIELDGTAYHNVRTVRERERIRKEQLESIGWNIYRIWSTDWIKDTKTEGEKLINAIENAIKNK